MTPVRTAAASGVSRPQLAPSCACILPERFDQLPHGEIIGNDRYAPPAEAAAPNRRSGGDDHRQAS